MTTTTTLYIKNMVCNRCIMVVKAQLEALDLHPLSVELGRVELAGEMNEAMLQSVRQSLEPLGFELIDDRRALLTEQIKAAVIDLVHRHTPLPAINLSDYLASHLHHDYSALSKLFSESTGTTLEKYFIAQKTERAKELLIYGELTLAEIADLLNYSSTAYFSAQFKSVTGLTPSRFRQLRENRRKPLDKV